MFEQKPNGSRRSSSQKLRSESGASIIVTLLVFMAAVALVRFVMPPLVEEVHYSIERGRQRAQYDLATEQLEDNPLANLSSASQLVNRRISPSVVHIDTSRGNVGPTHRLLELDDVARTIQGQGSGVIIHESGEILTNYHVIRGAEQLQVTLSDDRKLNAAVIGVDRASDLALLKVDEVVGLVPATWGDSDKLDEGAMVWAVGSPFGLSQTITFGIVSATARKSAASDHGPHQEFLQSDAAVSAGNSGGPLVDSLGDVVGINTAIIGPTYQGVSFAIPSNRAREIYDTILTRGPEEERGWLGVELGQGKPGEVLIERLVLVDRHSPAEEAGIKPGDIITKWDDTEVDSPSKLRHLVAQSKVDTVVDVMLKRGDADESLQVKVARKPLQF